VTAGFVSNVSVRCLTIADSLYQYYIQNCPLSKAHLLNTENSEVVVAICEGKLLLQMARHSSENNI
jgi:hypothetical protein